MPDFNATSGGAGVVLVNATQVGQVAGIDAVGSQLLITLNFRTLGPAAASPLSFDATVGTREVFTCPAPPAACTDITGMVTWSGGAVTAN